MNPTDEIAALRNELSLLRKETAALRKEMNTLHRYIHVQQDADTDEVTGITISCLEPVRNFAVNQSPSTKGANDTSPGQRPG